MDNNAFDAGIEPGGLRNQGDIKLLLCYLLLSVGTPLHRQLINDVMQENGLANYFEVNSAITSLLEQKSILETAPDVLGIDPSAAAGVETLESKLPFSVREKAVNSCLSLMARAKSAGENHVEIQHHLGGFYVTCSVSDGKDSLLNFRLYVADSMQANLVKEKFLDNPANFYESIVEKLFEN